MVAKRPEQYDGIKKIKNIASTQRRLVYAVSIRCAGAGSSWFVVFSFGIRGLFGGRSDYGLIPVAPAPDTVVSYKLAVFECRSATFSRACKSMCKVELLAVDGCIPESTCGSRMKGQRGQD
jgi:hypothetical protein